MIREIEQYIALFFIYSIAGWIMESVNISIRNKKVTNRGFLIGPYCPIYGSGVVLITILLQKYHDDIPATFFLSILICGALEYATSYLMEKIFKARWWDYSTRKFNINGRICLETLIPFGIAGTAITIWINPFLLKYINMVPNLAMHIILGIISILFIVDSVVSFKIILNLKEMSKEFKDNTDEISNKVKRIIRRKMVLYRRLVRAFPRIKENVFYSKWDEMKKRIEESKEEIATKIDNSREEFRAKIDISREKFRNNVDESKAEIKGKIDTSKQNVKRLYRKKEEK